MKSIILLGIAGCGKGTQSDLIKKNLGFLKVSAGDILRDIRKNPDHKFYKEINDTIDSGKLLTDNTVNQSVYDFVISNKHQYNGLLFDGYPRSEGQAEFVNLMLSEMNIELSSVILLDIKKEFLIDRLQNRFTCSNCGEIYNKINKNPKESEICDICGGNKFTHRSDDSDIDAIHQRFEEFFNKTSHVIDFYKKKNILSIIDASQSIDQVYIDICSIIKIDAQ
jgi:adenylate kinase